MFKIHADPLYWLLSSVDMKVQIRTSFWLWVRKFKKGVDKNQPDIYLLGIDRRCHRVRSWQGQRSCCLLLSSLIQTRRWSLILLQVAFSFPAFVASGALSSAAMFTSLAWMECVKLNFEFNPIYNVYQLCVRRAIELMLMLGLGLSRLSLLPQLPLSLTLQEWSKIIIISEVKMGKRATGKH